MELLTGLLVGAQLITCLAAGLYFYTMLKNGQGGKTAVRLDSKREIEDLKRLRGISLTEPLSEKTRPRSFDELIGQEKGVRALKAALCGPNPQHVLIYGPPGVGKTAAARLVLECAKQNKSSPFAPDAPFVEVDATILQFDERSIADPLVGSVHDPIYQGAGAYGQAGVPQPKPGAVTSAHGGVLFIDEIGELHRLQMNKLLKVLEDRRVFFSSSYYSPSDNNIPRYIHDIFKNGFPADFRLVGATTRSPDELPPALRSRCTEVFFRPLNAGEVARIADNSFRRARVACDGESSGLIARYAANGRDTVNIVQTAASIAALEGRGDVRLRDIEEVIEYGRYAPKSAVLSASADRIGLVNALAVCGGGGAVIEIEASAKPGGGDIHATGIVEEEEMNTLSGKMRRKSTARGSLENCATVLSRISELGFNDYRVHVNFPGGAPIDGPSAGIAVFIAIYSALKGLEVPREVAMTGEITIKGRVAPVGGIVSKIEAAAEAGIRRVIVPKGNYQRSLDKMPLEIVYVEHISEVISALFGVSEAVHCGFAAEAGGAAV